MGFSRQITALTEQKEKYFYVVNADGRVETAWHVYSSILGTGYFRRVHSNENIWSGASAQYQLSRFNVSSSTHYNVDTRRYYTDFATLL